MTNLERQKHIKRFVKRHPSFHKVMRTAQDLPLPPATHRLIDAFGKDAPAVVFYLAKHRIEYQMLILASVGRQRRYLRALVKQLAA